MYNNIYNIGISYIVKKNTLIDDKKTLTYYEIIDCAYGFLYDYIDDGLRFVPLSSYVGYSLGLHPTNEDEFCSRGFKSFYELCLKNNDTLSIEKFMNDFKKSIGIGTLCSYDAKRDCFETITSKKIIDKIKGSNDINNDFNDKNLNENSDISKMYSEIKQTIISQDEQIMKILTTLFKNHQVVNGSLDIDMISKLKENLLIYGPTGTGKTEILKRIAKIYKVPIVIEDATSFTESGYVGRNIQDMLDDLYLAAGKDIESAQKGILVIDEFDKLAEKEKGCLDSGVSREGVQRSLLKLLDGSEYYFDDFTFDTSKLTIIALGAFTNITVTDNYSDVTIKNFIDYGISRELMGRFSKLVAMNYLTKDDIKKILLKSNFSPINTYKCLFESMNINFTYDDKFIDYIAEKAVAENSGARSIKKVFDEAISGAMFKIFAGDYSSIHMIKPNNDENKPYLLSKK